MATLALAAAGAVAGGALLPGGIAVLGTTIGGAALGGQVGALAGSVIDQSLFGGSGQSREVTGPRLSELRVTSSTEGAAIPRLYGRARIGGQLIWATEHEEELVTSESGGSGKGGGTGGGAVTQTEYRYFANFAIALAEGEVTALGRVWADGKEIELTGISYRLHSGSETQEADSLIEAHEGASNAPAYRGVAYIVFEHFAIGAYGNRIPQLSFEVHRAVDRLNNDIRGVVVIPGSGEFAYATGPVVRTDGGNSRPAENVHTRQAATDWLAGIDQLEATLPNARSVSLVVSWFGTDLRAGHCEIRPGTESDSKATEPVVWKAGGQTRQEARVVSQKDGRPAYGGTPSDASVIQAILDLKSRGMRVVLTPFILMDIAENNELDNPYAPGSMQAEYPWRGRITVNPAAGLPGSADKTASAAAQVAAFVGTAAAGDFSIAGSEIVYSGPSEWSYRRHILHNAWLAKAAGGVDAFVIGTELRSLTTVRDGTLAYPFVAALSQLAADVKAVLGAETKVTYAADWSEYFGHQPQDGSGDVYFHLDPLWASPDIDAIGIDLYWPLADWRAGREHLDAVAGAQSVYDVAYLKANISGGEGYDWYYASEADRAAQVRTAITDGAGKPWVFRYKDIRGWWSNAHHDRPGGVESATPTPWVPQSKPIWLMETGCPAVNNGANQPNVFYDPKSSESALPHFSDGRRDDLMQRQYIRALVEAFDPAHPGYDGSSNPISSVYAGPMVDAERVHIYAWDARPYPAFPYDTDTWSDGDNWRLGHWLNGRVANGTLAETVDAILTDSGFEAFDASGLRGMVPGYVIDRILSVREALQPLELAYFFDAIDSGGEIRFRHRGSGGVTATLEPDHLAETRRGTAAATITRRQETDLPQSAKITYIQANADYAQGVAEGRRLAGASRRLAQAQLPLVLEPEQAGELADAWLFESWASREQVTFRLGPSQLALEPGDTVALRGGDRERLFRITEINEHGARDITASAFDGSVYDMAVAPVRRPRVAEPPQAGKPIVELLDLPLLTGEEPDTAGWVAASLEPWPGSVAFFRSPESTGFTIATAARTSAVLGITLEPLGRGPTSRIDKGAGILVKLDGGILASATHLKMLAGANAAALRHADGVWEVVQFERAELVGERTYRLSRLLRGQAGTEVQMSDELAAGARFVLLNAAVARTDLYAGEVGLALNWRFGPANRDIGHASYDTRQHTFAGIGRRPLSPVHGRGVRSGSDLTISWIRRTRRGGDSWDVIEVPLGEDDERYEVDILDGDDVVRTISTGTTSATYGAGEQIEDFGAVQASVRVAIYQTNASFGRGNVLRTTV
ncbi:MAG: hypothetical protein RLZ98_1006 [Pseudomonadota bacterium]|jgi:hypothetical protein